MGEGECAEGEVEPLQADGGEGGDGSGDAGDQGGEDVTQRRVATEELAHGERAETNETHLGERDLAGVAGEQDERQHDEPEDHALGDREQVGR